MTRRSKSWSSSHAASAVFSACGQSPFRRRIFGAVDATRAGEAVHVLPLVAPAVRRLRPLGGPPEVTDVLARADRHAIDETRGERPKLSGHGRGARLVEDREPLLDVSRLHVRTTLADEREHLRVAIARALGDLARVPELRERIRDVPLGEEQRDASREGQVSVLGGLRKPVELSLRVREPAAGDGERPAIQVIPGQGEREPRCTGLVARGAEPRIRALAQGDRLVEPPRPPGCVRVALEIVGSEIGAAGVRVRLVRLPPGMAPGCVPRDLDGGHRLKVTDVRPLNSAGFPTVAPEMLLLFIPGVLVGLVTMTVALWRSQAVHARSGRPHPRLHRHGHLPAARRPRPCDRSRRRDLDRVRRPARRPRRSCRRGCRPCCALSRAVGSFWPMTDETKDRAQEEVRRRSRRTSHPPAPRRVARGARAGAASPTRRPRSGSSCGRRRSRRRRSSPSRTSPTSSDLDRPVTFVFNGGPGASSAYLHVGAVGPQRVDFPAGRHAAADAAAARRRTTSRGSRSPISSSSTPSEPASAASSRRTARRTATEEGRGQDAGRRAGPEGVLRLQARPRVAVASSSAAGSRATAAGDRPSSSPARATAAIASAASCASSRRRPGSG